MAIDRLTGKESLRRGQSSFFSNESDSQWEPAGAPAPGETHVLAHWPRGEQTDQHDDGPAGAEPQSSGSSSIA